MVKKLTLLGFLHESLPWSKTSHEAWIDRLATSKPRKDPTPVASEALELALAELRKDLPSDSPLSGSEEMASLDAAMAFISESNADRVKAARAAAAQPLLPFDASSGHCLPQAGAQAPESTVARTVAAFNALPSSLATPPEAGTDGVAHRGMAR
jgi:2,4-dienoyl-CoA reductase-like NADH-dependent reductase (Old Yellow Enzyme family)